MRVTINELPQVPTGKNFWPWTEGTFLFTDNLPEGKLWPELYVVMWETALYIYVCMNGEKGI